VEESPLEIDFAVPVEGYCLVLFAVERVSGRLLDIVRAWHDQVLDTALIVVANRADQANKMAVLESGVSAYLAKPIALPELRARVRAALRRSRSQDTRLRRLSFGMATIDLETRIARTADRDVRITATEVLILKHLASHANQTVASNELVRVLWGTDPQKGVHSLRLFIRKLRQKLEPDPKHPRYLVTQPALGYRLQFPAELLNQPPEC
jgi:two-component system KDP operon response regulator KdpE